MDRATFKEQAKTRVGSYSIPSLPEVVWLSSLDVKSRNRIEKLNAKGDAVKAIAEDETFFPWLIATSLCEPDGKRLFDPNDDGDLKEIAAIDSKVAYDLVEAIFKHSGLVPEAAKEAEKN